MKTHSTPRLAPIVLLVLMLLAALAAPALAQEGAPPAPLSAAPSLQAMGAPCTPLSRDEQAVLDKLAQMKAAGQLNGADYDLFLKFSERAACVAQPAASDLAAVANGDCTPLSTDEQADYDKLAQMNKAGQLQGADYDLFLKLSERAACVARPAAPDIINTVSSYAFASSTGSYTALSSYTVSAAVGDDGAENIALPFTFNYDGVNYTTGRISVNGWLELGQTYTSSGYDNDLADTTAKPLLAPLWDDLYDDGASAEIRYATLGTTPNRTFVVQWTGILWRLISGTRQNFQVRLSETTNVIRFVYGAMNTPANTPTASIGVNDATGGSGHFISVTPATGTGDTYYNYGKQ